MKNLVYRLADFNRKKQDITKSMQTSYLILSTKTITAMYTCTRTIIPFCKLVVEIVMALLSFTFLATLVRLCNNDYIELVALCTQNINITANEFSAIFIHN